MGAQNHISEAAIGIITDLVGLEAAQSSTNCRVVEDHLRHFLRVARFGEIAHILDSMEALQHHAEGCAGNHYGGDSEQLGMPGWLVNTKDDLHALKALAKSFKLMTDA